MPFRKKSRNVYDFLFAREYQSGVTRFFEEPKLLRAFNSVRNLSSLSDFSDVRSVIINPFCPFDPSDTVPVNGEINLHFQNVIWSGPALLFPEPFYEEKVVRFSNENVEMTWIFIVAGYTYVHIGSGVLNEDFCWFHLNPENTLSFFLNHEIFFRSYEFDWGQKLCGAALKDLRFRKRSLLFR